MRGNVVPLERGLEDDTSPLWRALADPTRRRILDLLRQRPLITGEIAAQFAISRIAVMRHLEVLAEAGLVTSRKRGRERWHYMNTVPLQKLHRRWADPAAAGFASALLRLQDTIEGEGRHMEPIQPTIDIALDIEIAGTPAAVFAALTKDIGGWWGHPFMTARAISLGLEPRLGGLFTERWQNGGGLVIASVTGWAPDEHLALTGSFHHAVGVGVATFDLTESGGGTLLRFSFRAIGVVDAAVGEAMSRGWAELVGIRLKALAETGTRLGIDPDEPPAAVHQIDERSGPSHSTLPRPVRMTRPMTERNSEMPTEVASTEYGVITHHDEWNTLELKWLPTTKDATEAQARDTMTLFAAETEKRKPRFLIVDTTEFLHRWADDMMAWRDKEIIPHYNAGGVTKFAFIAGESVPFPTVESGADPAPEGPATFPTGWFTSRDRAYQWLAS